MNQEETKASGFEQHFGASEGTQDYFAGKIYKKIMYEWLRWMQKFYRNYERTAKMSNFNK